MLFIARNHHLNETHFKFSIFITMSWPSSIYVVSTGSIFIFTLIFSTINHIISLKQRHLIFTHFLEYLILVLDDNMDEKGK